MAEPMAASIYEVGGLEQVLPGQDVYDEETGLPVYIAPWILRDESDYHGEYGTPGSWAVRGSPLRRPRPLDEQIVPKPLPGFRKAGNLECVTGQKVKKKRNFWLSFRKSKASAASVVSLMSPSTSTMGRASTTSSAELPGRPAAAKMDGTMISKAADASVRKMSAAGRTGGGRECAAAPLDLIAGLSISVEAFGSTSTPRTRDGDKKGVPRGLMDFGHRIIVVIPEGNLFSDELRARFCC
jgi:hypothetical protein